MICNWRHHVDLCHPVYVTRLIDIFDVTLLTWLTDVWHNSLIDMWHDSLTWLFNVTWLIGMCVVTHWYVWHDSLMCVTWLIAMCYVWHDSTHWHDSMFYMTWLIDMCDMTHGYVWHGWSMYMTWLIDTWLDSVTRLIDMWHDSLICDMTSQRIVFFGDSERWGAGVETQKNVRGEIGGWGRVPFNETYAPSLSTIYDGA